MRAGQRSTQRFQSCNSCRIGYGSLNKPSSCCSGYLSGELADSILSVGGGCAVMGDQRATTGSPEQYRGYGKCR